MTQKSTLLAALWNARGDDRAIVRNMERGDLKLTGNFKYREREIVEEIRRLKRSRKERN